MVVTKEMICNKLITDKKYSTSSITKLKKNKKEDLVKMYEEIFGSIEGINLSDENRLELNKLIEAKKKGYEAVLEYVENLNLFD